jgi:hypothetical protein
MDWPAGHPLEPIGRLSKAESLVFLGPDAATCWLRLIFGLSLLCNPMVL